MLFHLQEGWDQLLSKCRAYVKGNKDDIECWATQSFSQFYLVLETYFNYANKSLSQLFRKYFFCGGKKTVPGSILTFLSPSQSDENNRKSFMKKLTEHSLRELWTQPDSSFLMQQAVFLSFSLLSSISLRIFASLLIQGPNLAPRCMRSAWKKIWTS